MSNMWLLQWIIKECLFPTQLKILWLFLLRLFEISEWFLIIEQKSNWFFQNDWIKWLFQLYLKVLTFRGTGFRSLFLLEKWNFKIWPHLTLHWIQINLNFWCFVKVDHLYFIWPFIDFSIIAILYNCTCRRLLNSRSMKRKTPLGTTWHFYQAFCYPKSWLETDFSPRIVL